MCRPDPWLLLFVLVPMMAFGAILPGAAWAEVCDGVDDDGDGMIDEEEAEFAVDCAAIPDWAPEPGEYLNCAVQVPDARLPLSFSVAVEFDHPCTEQLVLELVSPAGTIINLSTNHGSCSGGASAVEFDDDAGRDIVGQSAPWFGSFRAETVLSDCIAAGSMEGAWTLRVVDEIEDGVGSVGRFAMLVEYAPVDLDSDGYGQQCDCDDQNELINPGVDKDLTNGIDDDCDGLIDNIGRPGDWDGDGVGPEEGDCDDDDPLRFAGAIEACDGVDNDCDSLIPPNEFDVDEDGFASCAGDCNPADSSVFPGAPELCDYADNDCDGQVDEQCGDHSQLTNACGCTNEIVSNEGGRFGLVGLALAAGCLLIVRRKRI